MRLLKQTTSGKFQLHEFPGGNSDGDGDEVEYGGSTRIPPYAILSHTWSRRGAQDEISFRDVMACVNDGDDGSSSAAARRIKASPGYAKLRYCADQAARDGLDYFWVDTCCIDKSSSAELSESLNSMFRWYRHARRCYAYLEDVSVGEEEEGQKEQQGKREGEIEVVDDDEDWAVVLDRTTTAAAAPPAPTHDDAAKKKTEKAKKTNKDKENNNDNENEDAWREAFRSSRWFTRGWTLQELLAPAQVIFYSSDWTRLGDRTSLEQDIHLATGIPVAALRGESALARFEVRERMAWASGRVTRREEDKAYSLLGIFGVYMPMIYGEGERAAMRRLYRTIRDSADDGEETGLEGVLQRGARLQRFQTMRSPDGRVSLRLEDDGNLVLRDVNEVLWASHTLGRRDAAYLEMQDDGNLVLYTRLRSPIWASGTMHHPSLGSGLSELRVGNDGDANIYRNGKKVWTTLTSGIPRDDLLWVDTSLMPGQFLISEDGRYRAILQEDGNLVLEGPMGIRWSSQTGGNSDVEELVMQSDGNLVIYVKGHDAMWDSGSRAGARPVLVMQNDGNLVIYACGTSVWATGTNE